MADRGLSSTTAAGGKAAIQKYQMVLPEIWDEMQRRLKHGTAPTTANVLSAERDLESILRNPNYSDETKRLIFSDALRRFKNFQDIEKQMKPHTTTTRQREHLLAAAATPRAHYNSPFVAAALSPAQLESSWANLPEADVSPFQQVRSTESPKESEEPEAFASPAAPAPAGPSIPKIYKDAASYFSPKSQEGINEFINALSAVPTKQFSIDPESQEILISGKPIRQSHIIDILETINSKSPIAGKDQLPPGTKETAQILAKNTNLPATSIKSPNIREYVVGIRQKAAATQAEVPKKWKEVSSLSSKTRKGVSHKTTYKE